MKKICKNLAILTVTSLSFQSCQQKEGFYSKTILGAQAGDPIANIISTPQDENVPTPPVALCDQGSSDNIICNPLGGGDSTPPAVPASSRQGLIASLYEGEGGWNFIEQYQNNGYKHPELIYFSNFNVPTRAFDEGFGFSGGDYLRNQHGDKLIEWFAIFASGNITLPADSAEGYFHITTLSDDGIRVTVDGKRIINNPHEHAPTLNCASELIQLHRGEEKSFELGYFQGPRYHIALMTLIKKIDDPATFVNGPHCHGSDPQALIDQGYRVMEPAWFTLPAGF